MKLKRTVCDKIARDLLRVFLIQPWTFSAQWYSVKKEGKEKPAFFFFGLLIKGKKLCFKLKWNQNIPENLHVFICSCVTPSLTLKAEHWPTSHWHVCQQDVYEWQSVSERERRVCVCVASWEGPVGWYKYTSTHTHTHMNNVHII